MKARVVLAIAAVVVAIGGLVMLVVALNAPAEPAVRVVAPPPTPAPTTAVPERRQEPPKLAAAPPKPKAADAPPAVVEAPAATGTLTITSDVPDASVFVDRVYLGSAPVTAKDLTPGTHKLNMSATGYDGIAEDIEVLAGTHELAVSFKTVKLDAKLEVVHKHGVGSCQGTLIATPQGLTYDSTNAGDAFKVALTDLETFEVDYISKNLRVKIRKGRTFNFTDPEGKPDRLYFFQREVEKARQRLISGKNEQMGQ